MIHKLLRLLCRNRTTQVTPSAGATVALAETEQQAAPVKDTDVKEVTRQGDLPKIRIYFFDAADNIIVYRCPLIRGWELRCPAIPECHRNAVRRSLMAYVRALQSAGEQVPTPLKESFVLRFYRDKYETK